MPTDESLQIASKPRPRFLRALGATDPPEVIEIAGHCFQRIDIFKHDSWAATAVYESTHQTIVCKFNREQNLFGLPMSWLGRILARRERFFLQQLADLDNVPDYVGPVCIEERELPNAVAHVYIEGHPVGVEERVSDEFFPLLKRTIEELHARGMAYIDLHKSENILVAPDGRPHLIDFQVSFCRPQNRFLAGMMGRIEKMLQELDLYHLQKHLTLKRPDLAGYDWDQFNYRNERPWWIKTHRRIATPIRIARRKFLVFLGIRKDKGLASSEQFPEHSVRRESKFANQTANQPRSRVA